MRVVIDTNLWLSGLMLPGSVPGHIVLATCLASGANYLLTGDDDLLALKPKYAILTAREFYEQHLR